MAEDSARIDPEKYIADVRVKCVNLYLQNGARRERCRVQKSDNRLDSPRASHRHTVQDLTIEASVPKHDLVGVLVPFPSRRNARSSARSLEPVVDDARQFELPWLVATQCPVTPEQNDHTIRCKPARRVRDDYRSIEPVEGVPRGDYVDAPGRELGVLRPRETPFDSVVIAFDPRTPVLDHVRFGIDRDNTFEERSQRTPYLTNASTEIHEQASPVQRQLDAQDPTDRPRTQAGSGRSQPPCLRKARSGTSARAVGVLTLRAAA